ncbi:MAG: ABC transporter ATP-binding protein [Planctomycetia bacterium]|nr:ABC transporter ATP-binding protein [Planctomycetia bacterium]
MTNESPPPLYELIGVSKSFPVVGRKAVAAQTRDVSALEEVNLQIAAGEFLAVLGRSGEGKSTLLHLLGGLDEPTSGSLYFRGRTLRDYGIDRFRREQVGFVFQNFHLLSYRTALDNVATGLTIAGYRTSRARTEARKWPTELGLSQRMEHRPSELSGGECQRVAIARAVVKKPAVLLADEPTGNLDRTSREQVLEAIASLHRDHGITVVMVTHNLDDAQRYATRIVQIADRRVNDDTTTFTNEECLSARTGD